MGDSSTIVNSNIPRVYDGVLIGSYSSGVFVLQTGTFSSPTRDVTFSYRMSNNNDNWGNKPQADYYRVEFRTYAADGTRLNYYNVQGSNIFGWTTFTNTPQLSQDAVSWDIGFRFADAGFWNGNFAASLDDVSLIAGTTTITPAYTSYDTSLVAILQQKQQELQAAQSALSSFPALTINSPSNLVASVESEIVTLDWDAPTSGLIPERYAISWTIPGNAGWGIATGNVGDANVLNTSIVINKSVIASTGGWNKDYTFKIRSDHDSGSMYSAWSNEVTVNIVEPYTPASLPFAYQYRLDENAQISISAPSGKMIETITAWYGDPNDGNYGALVTDTLTSLNSGETSTVISATNDVFGDPVPGVGKILIFNISYVDLPDSTPPVIVVIPSETNTVTTPSETTTVTTPAPSETSTVTIPAGPTEAEIAATTAALAAAQAAEAARIQAETAALIAAQAAAAQAEAERIAAEEAAREAARIKAEAEAQAEADRIEAEIEAARIQAEIEAKAEEDRIAAELKAAEEKAEAEAKAEAERIEAERIAEEERIAKEAEEEAERIAAEEKAIAEAKAKAEAEALAEEERIAKEAEAKELEEEKAAEEEAQAKEEELNEILEDAKDGKELTEEQKEVVVAALIEDLKPGESISAAEVQASGVSYADLPPETPVELRTDENGNALIITAEVAANIELVQDPGALLEAAFTDPGAALAALGSIGADMTEAEREEATEMVVATVVAAGAAINAAAVAAGGATGGSTGGGSSGGGGASGANSPGSRGGRKW
jgi:DNA segregation ATPase FtsK/SpoIIIE-like protein